MPHLGRFEIIRELGRGGMGVVYRAHDPDMARDVAIKVLRGDVAMSEAERDEIARRFEREARSAGSLNHPNIVAHYERGEVDGSRFIVMELVEGQSLHQLMTSGMRPGLQSSLEILRQMAAALDYAHARGVVHRDIKPGNVLVQPGPVVKIADFGIAKSTLGGSTTASMVVGSPNYMAPEQIEGLAITGKTDQWALAVTAYELVAGRKPFESDSVASLFHKILQAPAPDPGEELQSMRPVFARALAKLPGDRFGTCADFTTALQSAVAGNPPLQPVRELSRNRRSLKPTLVQLWVAGILVVLAGGLGIAVLWPKPPVKRQASAEVPAVPANFKAGQTRINRRDAQTYVWIPPGNFRMGCSPGDGDCHDDEAARNVVIGRGFWLAQNETSVGAYRLFTKATGTKMPQAPDFDPDWSTADVPVTGITWEAAAGYCEWAQGRLPSEAEWEYAARAGAPEIRYGPLDEVAWYAGNSKGRPHTVKTLQPNAFGLFDMLGNVWEWTADSEQDGRFRILRGGSWLRSPAEIRASHRNPVSGSNPDHATGMRCAADLLP